MVMQKQRLAASGALSVCSHAAVATQKAVGYHRNTIWQLVLAGSAAEATHT